MAIVTQDRWLVGIVSLVCAWNLAQQPAAARADEEPPAATRDSASEQPGLAARAEQVAAELAAERYLLQYRLDSGQTLRYRVEHVATVDTTIEGSNQKSQSRSVATKQWRVLETTADGHVRFEHLIEDVDMWSEVTGRKAVQYNSRTDQEVPPQYEGVAEQIGKPLAEITIDRSGRVLHREDHTPQKDLGYGGITIPLPTEPVAVGASWSDDSQLHVRNEKGQFRKIQIRQKLTLLKVQTGVATIELRTEVLTPVHDARVRSQLVQRLTNGQIRFDLDAGQVLSKQLEWNETVLAFNGPDSNMKYLARFTETLLEAPQTAARPTEQK